MLFILFFWGGGREERLCLQVVLNLYTVILYSFFVVVLYLLSVPTERSKELCAWDAFLTQNVVDVFRVLRIALRTVILKKYNCRTSFERSSHNGLKTLTLILLKALMRTNEERGFLMDEQSDRAYNSNSVCRGFSFFWPPKEHERKTCRKIQVND